MYTDSVIFGMNTYDVVSKIVRDSKVSGDLKIDRISSKKMLYKNPAPRKVRVYLKIKRK